MQEIDPLTDADRSRISTDNLDAGPFSRARLIWRCSQKEGNGSSEIELAVLVDEFLDIEGRVPVRWRFDQDPASPPKEWNISTTGIAVFAPAVDRDEFTTAAKPASEVLVRVSDFRGVTRDLRFSLRGVSAALSRLPCIGSLSDVEDSGPTPEGAGPTAPTYPDPVGSSGGVDISASPTFTPFTVAPEILNREAVIEGMAREYPPLLRNAGIGGTVRVYFFIDENGAVRDARIEQSSGHQDLDNAALAVARLYRFSPALNDHEPVSAWVSFPITFQVRRE